MAAAYSQAAVDVFEEWKATDHLCHMGAKMYLASIGRKDNVDRAEIAENHLLLAPVLAHMGFLICEVKGLCTFLFWGCNKFTGKACPVPVVESYSHCLGLRPSLASLMEATEMFLNYCRPRGKALPTSQGPTHPSFQKTIVSQQINAKNLTATMQQLFSVHENVAAPTPSKEK